MILPPSDAVQELGLLAWRPKAGWRSMTKISDVAWCKGLKLRRSFLQWAGLDRLLCVRKRTAMRASRCASHWWR